MCETIRVIHCIGSLVFGGSQAFVMEMFRKIDREKVVFDFVIFPNGKGAFYDEIIQLGGRVYVSPRYNGKNHFVFVSWWKKFFREHEEYKVLHGHVRSVASIYIPIAKKAGLYTIAHSHSTSNGSGINGKIKDIMQLSVRWQADYLFACSNEAGQWMFGKNIEKRGNYKVIPNAIDTKRFVVNVDKRVEIRKSLGIGSKFVIGTVGRLSKEKNQKFLIDVFADVYKKNPKTVLLLVGDGDLRITLEQQAKKLGIGDAVIFVGGKSNIEDYYQVMDIFAFPSLWEGLGIVVIEAQCSGLRCIVSERLPASVDMKVGLVEVVNLANKKEWVDKLHQKNKKRKSPIGEVKKAGYDVTENAMKLQNFYLKLSKGVNGKI